MIVECSNYLIDKVNKAGIKTKVKTTLKDLKASSESHIGAVLFEDDEFEKNIQKVIYTDELGNKKKRKKIFDRKTTFSVVVGEYEQVKCQNIFSNFMTLIESGIYIDGNYVEIIPKKAAWVEDKDSILKSKVAVQILIEFNGGIYKESGFKKIEDIDIEVNVDKE